MLQQLKHFFVPHEGNNYHPHILHTKRAVFYSAVFASMKALLFIFALLLPTEVFLVPDVLDGQVRSIVELTNQVRAQKGLPKLTGATSLYASADARASDMSANNYFSHIGPNGHTLAYFLKQVGYKYSVAGENLAMGFSDPQSVVDAWIKSPTHYSNLIDSDYDQIGVGVVVGYFNGQPTVYVAQHFGQPAKEPLVPPEMYTSSATTAVAGSTPIERVKGVKIVEAATTAEQVPTRFHPESSFVYWTDLGGSTKFDVRATIDGAVTTAIVLVQNFPIELHPTSNGKYAGTLTVNEPVDTFFHPVITPVITIYGDHNETIQDSIDWYDVKIVGVTPVQKYLRAKEYLSPITNIFSVSNTVYWGFLGLFTLALVINIVVEVRKQRYEIIAQTLLIIGFLIWLLRV